MLTITLKTLQQQTFKIEIDPDLKVSGSQRDEVNTVRPGRGQSHPHTSVSANSVRNERLLMTDCTDAAF